MGKNDRRRNKQRTRNNSLWQEKSPKRERKRFVKPESPEEIALRENAIREFKARENICPACGKPITDIAEAIADKSSGQPMHFDCVIERLKASENPTDGQHLTYIGQGRFAIVTYKNPRDKKTFKIERIIEWEDKERPSAWRGEMADLFSKVK